MQSVLRHFKMSMIIWKVFTNFYDYLVMNISKKIAKLIAGQLALDEKEVVPEASLRDDLNADSIDEVEILMQLEEDFKLSIPDAEAQEFKTVGDVCRYLEARIPQ